MPRKGASTRPEPESDGRVCTPCQKDQQLAGIPIGKKTSLASPSDDYANFGLGLALARTGNHAAAAEYLALAAAMRPDDPHYTEALRSVRATLRARKTAEEGTE